MEGERGGEANEPWMLSGPKAELEQRWAEEGGGTGIAVAVAVAV